MGCCFERFLIFSNRLFLSIKRSFIVGHHKYFKKMASEEREHANKFMNYQNKRGGTIVLVDIKVTYRVNSLNRIEDTYSSPFSIIIVETRKRNLGFITRSASRCIGFGKRCLSSFIGIARNSNSKQVWNRIEKWMQLDVSSLVIHIWLIISKKNFSRNRYDQHELMISLCYKSIL